MISIAHISAIGPTTAAMTYGTSSSPGGADMSVLDCPIATLPKGRLPLQAPANRGTVRPRPPECRRDPLVRRHRDGRGSGGDDIPTDG
jgi:hypothetical protein